MRRLAVVLLSACASLASAAPLVAQSTGHPDFSGKWSLDVSKLEGPMAQAGITSATMTITQDAKVMKQDQSMSSAMGSSSVSVSYNLDGTESKNTMSQGPMSMEMTSKTSWDGATLVISTKSEIQGSPYERTDRYSLDASGKVLTIDSNVSVMGQTMAVKQIFNKS